MLIYMGEFEAILDCIKPRLKTKKMGPMECNCISSSGDQRQTEPWGPNSQCTPDSVSDPASINKVKHNRGRQCEPTSGFHLHEHMCADKNKKGNLDALLTFHMNLRICFSIPQRRWLRLQQGLNGICKSPILLLRCMALLADYFLNAPFLFFIRCTCEVMSTCEAGACGVQRRGSDLLQLEFQTVVSHPTRVRRTELWSSSRGIPDINH